LFITLISASVLAIFWKSRDVREGGFKRLSRAPRSQLHTLFSALCATDLCSALHPSTLRTNTSVCTSPKVSIILVHPCADKIIFRRGVLNTPTASRPVLCTHTSLTQFDLKRTRVVLKYFSDWLYHYTSSLARSLNLDISDPAPRLKSSS
jgi:hypothetical protein